MKTIGLIGGMSWESSALYYEIINNIIKERLGGLHSAQILMYSVDFSEIEKYQSKGEWDKSAEYLIKVAKTLENGGADFIVICTNTMHKVASKIQEKISIPILHIADATAQQLRSNKINKVALLGTKYTMTQDFYKDIIKGYDIEILVPNNDDIEIINNIIYDELCLGIISDESKRKYQNIIEKFIADGAQGVILGCTEIGLLIKQDDSSLPIYDTTYIHANKAALYALDID